MERHYTNKKQVQKTTPYIQNTSQPAKPQHSRHVQKPHAEKNIQPRPRRQKPEETLSPDSVRFYALGGLEEVGRNMSVFEYKNDIVLIDAGIQFPEEDTPGIDYIIPNISSLEPKKKNIKGLLLTHAHYDHIGAIPYIMEKLGNPTIYTTALTKAMIERRQEEFPNAPKLDVEVIKEHEVVRLSDNIEVEFYGIVHSIPDAMGVLLRTPAGNFAYSTDLKFDYDERGNVIGDEGFKWAGNQNILAMFLDSTNAERPGTSVSEKTVEKNIDEILTKAQGRIIIGLFSSVLTRIAEIIKIAESHGKVIAFSGLSMKTNVQIAQNLGYMKIKKDTVIPLEEIHKYRDDKVLILSTGAQGEENASLMRIANGEHRFVTIKPTDTVVFSSSVIAGNERSVQTLKDNIARQGAKIYHSQIMDLHSSGHATKDELRKMVELVHPKYFVPIHGYYFMRSTNAELATEAGVDRKNCLVVDNGQIIEFTKNNARITDESVPAYYVMVDGLGVGDVGEVVLRDRKLLAEEGMIVIIATLERKSNRFLKNPDIISRGFIYLRENTELVEDLRKKIKGIISKIPANQNIETEYLKGLIRDQIGQFLYNKTKRRPMVLPVIIQV